VEWKLGLTAGGGYAGGKGWRIDAIAASRENAAASIGLGGEPQR
jgi:hypothetical protein